MPGLNVCSIEKFNRINNISLYTVTDKEIPVGDTRVKEDMLSLVERRGRDEKEERSHG